MGTRLHYITDQPTLAIGCDPLSHQLPLHANRTQVIWVARLPALLSTAAAFRTALAAVPRADSLWVEPPVTIAVKVAIETAAAPAT